MQGELQARRRAGKSKPGLMMRTTEKRVLFLSSFFFFSFSFFPLVTFFAARGLGEKRIG